MRTRRLLAASSLALVLGVTAAPLAGATEPAAPGDRAAAAGADHRATAAREALAEVEQIFAGTPAGGAEGTA